jgi:hypothetical protein
MMQTVKDWTGYHPQMRWNPVPVLLKWHRRWWERLWDIWTQGHVRATSVVMWHPLIQETPQVVLGEKDQKVQALSS